MVLSPSFIFTWTAVTNNAFDIGKNECQFLHVLAQKSFHLARILNSPQKVTCPSGKLRTEFTSSIAKSTSPGLLDTTFFACWFVKSLSILQLWWHSGFIHPKNARFFFKSWKSEPAGDNWLWTSNTRNLVPRVLSYPPYRARERETLENAGHVSPRIWEITNKWFGGGAGKCEICLYRA